MVILGRIVRWGIEGIEFEADPKHRDLAMGAFSLNGESKGLSCNGDKENKVEEDWELEEVGGEEATEFRGHSARLNFLGQDSPDLQFPVKQVSRDMAKPLRGSWGKMKKIARYLVGRKRVLWVYRWQDEPGYCYVATDSDWGVI